MQSASNENNKSDPMAALQTGVTEYVRSALVDSGAWIGMSTGVDVDGRSWTVEIRAWEDAEHNRRVEQAVHELIGAVREVDMAVMTATDQEYTEKIGDVFSKLRAYDQARARR